MYFAIVSTGLFCYITCMKESARNIINRLVPLLKDAVPGVRNAAAEAIEKLEAAVSLEDIFATLKNGDTGAKIGAIYALGEIGGDQVLAPLVYCSKRSEVDIRSAAVAALGKLAMPVALPVLLELLDDASPIVQGRVLAALRNFTLTAAQLDKIRFFLAASDGVLEAEAALTLASHHDASVLEQICALLESRHAATRQAAATALGLLPLQ